MPHLTLVSAELLIDHIDDPDWLVIDVRHELQDISAGRKAYEAGHIPGAIFLHMDEDLSAPKTGLNGRHPLPDREAFATKLAENGLNRSSQVVIYDAAEGMMAARLWWMLRWCGHEAVAVLEGGWSAWNKLQAPVTNEPEIREKGNFRLAPALTAQVDTMQVLANIDTREKLVLDARGPNRFRGENETMDPVGGHIPGALNRCFRDNLDERGHFKSEAVLREEFSRLIGPYAPTQVIAQCGSGVTACHNLLAMEIAGLSGAALYPGSWSEWCSNPERPIATGG